MEKAMEQLQTDLLRSVQLLVESVRQMETGKVPVLSPEGKISVSIQLSPEVLEHFRAGGEGWQARMDSELADWLNTYVPTETRM